MTNRRFLNLLIVLALLGGMARAGWVAAHPGLMRIDVDGYLDIGSHLAAGAGYSAGNPPYFTAFRPPLYPLLVAAALRLPGELHALAALQVVMGLLTILVTGLLARRLGTSSIAALAAGLVVAVDPVLIHVTATPMTETLCTLLVALWGYSIASSSPTISRACFSGFLLGLLALCRPTFLPYTLLQLAAVLLLTNRKNSTSSPENSAHSRTWRRSAVIQFLCVTLCLFPWFLRNGLVVGKWTPATTHGGYTLLLGNNSTFYREVLHGPWGTAWSGESLLPWQQELETRLRAAQPPLNTEPQRDQWFYREAFDTMRRQPTDFLLSCLYRFTRLWDILPQDPQRAAIPLPVRWGMAAWFSLLWFGLLVGIGVLFQRRNSAGFSPPSGFLLLMILNVTAVHLLYWTDLRMRAPLIPLVAILAIQGWQTLLGRSTPSPQTTGKPHDA